MRLSARAGVGGVAVAVALTSCVHPSPDPGPGEPPESPDRADRADPAVVVEREPGQANGGPPPEWDPEAVFVGVYEALLVGDGLAFERFAGAPRLRLVRASSLGEDPPEVELVASERVRAWVAALARTWAPLCAEQPEPPCRSLNPLSLGVEDAAALELRCAPAGADELATQCCRQRPPLVHNTPFLVGLCFDERGRVTGVELLDG